MYMYKNNGRVSFSDMGEENLSTSTDEVLFIYIHNIYVQKPGVFRGRKEKGKKREGQEIAVLVRLRTVVNVHDGRKGRIFTS